MHVSKIYGNTHLLLLVIAQAIGRADEAKSQFQTIFINTLWPTWAVGVYRAMNNGLGFFGFWFSGRMIDRFKETYVLAVQQAYWLVSQTIGLILSNVISPLLFMSGSILFGPGIVARDYLLQKEFTDEQRRRWVRSLRSQEASSMPLSPFGLALLPTNLALPPGLASAWP